MKIVLLLAVCIAAVSARGIHKRHHPAEGHCLAFMAKKGSKLYDVLIKPDDTASKCTKGDHAHLHKAMHQALEACTDPACEEIKNWWKSLPWDSDPHAACKTAIEKSFEHSCSMGEEEAGHIEDIFDNMQKSADCTWEAMEASHEIVCSSEDTIRKIFEEKHQKKGHSYKDHEGTPAEGACLHYMKVKGIKTYKQLIAPDATASACTIKDHGRLHHEMHKALMACDKQECEDIKNWWVNLPWTSDPKGACKTVIEASFEHKCGMGQEEADHIHEIFNNMEKSAGCNWGAMEASHEIVCNTPEAEMKAIWQEKRKHPHHKREHPAALGCLKFMTMKGSKIYDQLIAGDSTANQCSKEDHHAVHVNMHKALAECDHPECQKIKQWWANLPWGTDPKGACKTAIEASFDHSCGEMDDVEVGHIHDIFDKTDKSDSCTWGAMEKAHEIVCSTSEATFKQIFESKRHHHSKREHPAVMGCLKFMKAKGSKMYDQLLAGDSTANQCSKQDHVAVHKAVHHALKECDHPECNEIKDWFKSLPWGTDPKGACKTAIEESFHHSCAEMDDDEVEHIHNIFDNTDKSGSCSWAAMEKSHEIICSTPESTIRKIFEEKRGIIRRGIPPAALGCLKFMKAKGSKMYDQLLAGDSTANQCSKQDHVAVHKAVHEALMACDHEECNEIKDFFRNLPWDTDPKGACKTAIEESFHHSCEMGEEEAGHIRNIFDNTDKSGSCNWAAMEKSHEIICTTPESTIRKIFEEKRSHHHKREHPAAVGCMKYVIGKSSKVYDALIATDAEASKCSKMDHHNVHKNMHKALAACDHPECMEIKNWWKGLPWDSKPKEACKEAVETVAEHSCQMEEEDAEHVKEIFDNTQKSGSCTWEAMGAAHEIFCDPANEDQIRGIFEEGPKRSFSKRFM